MVWSGQPVGESARVRTDQSAIDELQAREARYSAYRIDHSKWSHKRLKDACRHRNLYLTGSNAELKERLEGNDNEQLIERFVRVLPEEDSQAVLDCWDKCHISDKSQFHSFTIQETRSGGEADPNGKIYVVKVSSIARLNNCPSNNPADMWLDDEIINYMAGLYSAR